MRDTRYRTFSHGCCRYPIQLFNPPNGAYTITVVGLKLGEYNVAVSPYAQDGSIEPKILIPGVAAPNSSSTAAGDGKLSRDERANAPTIP